MHIAKFLPWKQREVTFLCARALTEALAETNAQNYCAAQSRHFVPPRTGRARLRVVYVDRFAVATPRFQRWRAIRQFSVFQRLPRHLNLKHKYKKRTNEKKDGCALLWNSKVFELIDYR